MTQPTGTPSNGVENLPYNERDEDYHEFEEYDEVTKPTTRPFYKRRKYWIFCAIMTVITVAIGVPIALFVILPKVAQLILNNSTMSFHDIRITEPTNTTLMMSMQGNLGSTGPFPATIQFPEPIQVYYKEQLLGSMVLHETKASGGKGTISDSSVFSISDVDAFGKFSADMVSISSPHDTSLFTTVTFDFLNYTYFLPHSHLHSLYLHCISTMSLMYLPLTRPNGLFHFATAFCHYTGAYTIPNQLIETLHSQNTNIFLLLLLLLLAHTRTQTHTRTHPHTCAHIRCMHCCPHID